MTFSAVRACCAFGRVHSRSQAHLVMVTSALALAVALASSSMLGPEIVSPIG